MVKLNNLSFGYNGKPIVTINNWNLNQGEDCLFLGHSGCGKTTLLHLLAGLLKPNQGQIEIAGTDITRLSADRLDLFRGRHIGLIFQTAHMIDALSVKDNLMLAQYLAGLPKDLERIREILEDLGIGNKLNSRIHELSQGETQRVTIARAMLNKPDVILADEPTSSLDDRNCDKVTDLIIRQAAKYKATLVISTHDQRIKSKFSKTLILEKS
jgi:putative ABC transport system ATP-binding protein